MKAIIDGLIVLPNEIINGHVIMYEKDLAHRTAQAVPGRHVLGIH